MIQPGSPWKHQVPFSEAISAPDNEILGPGPVADVHRRQDYRTTPDLAMHDTPQRRWHKVVAGVGAGNAAAAAWKSWVSNLLALTESSVM